MALELHGPKRQRWQPAAAARPATTTAAATGSVGEEKGDLDDLVEVGLHIKSVADSSEVAILQTSHLPPAAGQVKQRASSAGGMQRRSTPSRRAFASSAFLSTLHACPHLMGKIWRGLCCGM
jgi:hypothetical protein